MRKKRQSFEVMCLRVRLWIMQHYSAGGHRRKTMNRMVARYEATLGSEFLASTEERKAVAIVQKGLNQSNARNVLNWMLSVKNEDGKRLPTSLTAVINQELRTGGK